MMSRDRGRHHQPTDNTAFHDLPAEAFPFTLQFIAQRTGETVHTITVTEPAGVVTVPALREQHGLISVHIKYADGTEYRG